MPLSKRLPFIISYTKLTTPEVWDYYVALMDRLISTKDVNGRKLLKILSDMTQDEYFGRIDKLTNVKEEKK